MKIIGTGANAVYLVEGDSTSDQIYQTGAQVLMRALPQGMATPQSIAQLTPLVRARASQQASPQARRAATEMQQMAKSMLQTISAHVALLERQPTIYQGINWFGGYNTLTPPLVYRTPYDGQPWRIVGIHASREQAIEWGLTQIIVGGLNHIIFNQNPPSPVANPTVDISIFEPAGRRDGMIFPISGNLLAPEATVTLQFRNHNLLSIGSELHVQLLVQANPCAKQYGDNSVYRIASKVGWALQNQSFGRPGRSLPRR